jgi:hypothetical protein
VEHDDSNDDGATSQHTQTHQHSKSVTDKVVAPIVATGHTDPNALDMQRIEFQPDRDFQVYQGIRYRLATTPQADAVQLNLDKKGKNSVKGMEPPAWDPGLNDLHIQKRKNAIAPEFTFATHFKCPGKYIWGGYIFEK